MNEQEQKLYSILAEMGISDYTVTEHTALLHSDDAEAAGAILPGLTMKNLLLRRKKSDRFYLLLTDYRDHADLKHYKQIAEWGQVRFAREEEMSQLLGVTTGAVSPLALFNDTEHKITVVLARDITSAAPDAIVNVHPCRNTATLSMRKEDLMQFLERFAAEIICE